jgi:outer membrane protein assembly factor BamD
MKIFKLMFALTLIAGSSALWVGCAGKGVNEADPKSMYEDADKDIANDRYLLALDKLRVVKSKFSYTSYGALAQLRIGDVYFLQESYPEASAAYENFVELYPKNEKAPYALFRAGESYFKDIPEKVERDLRTAESAISTFTLYLKKYPNGEYVGQAKDMKQQSYNKLAEKELLVAKFYIRRHKSDAARLRLQKLLDQYGDSTSATEAKDLLRNLGKE